ncbi:MarR family winged helix-turn-helix transcriptional regulator [Arthrobacter sp. NPDC090010]|uniref:MarR family winged helix-turn-helix transcriptional regulator n=1 Tax=Arthrobacter sp. NPDC090010 TaxID=3363942 RepID=UPI003829D592
MAHSKKVMGTAVSTDGVAAIRAWMRLSDALAAFDRHLRSEFGITGGQLAILRIIAEGEITLVELRNRLAMHPATLGQVVDRIVRLGLLVSSPLDSDRRVRVLTLTEDGLRLLRKAPLAGPVRLRSAADSESSRFLGAAFTEALSAFGLERWTDS